MHLDVQGMPINVRKHVEPSSLSRQRLDFLGSVSTARYGDLSLRFDDLATNKIRGMKRHAVASFRGLCSQAGLLQRVIDDCTTELAKRGDKPIDDNDVTDDDDHDGEEDNDDGDVDVDALGSADSEFLDHNVTDPRKPEVGEGEDTVAGAGEEELLSKVASASSVMNKQRKELAAAVVSDDDFADPRPQRIKHKSQHLRTPYNEGKSKAKAVVPKRKKVEPEGALPITRKRRKTKATEVAPSTTIGNSVQIDGVLLEELVLTYAWHGVGDRNEELREVQDNTISLRKIDAESSKPSTMIEHNFIDCYGDYLNRQEVAKGGGVVSRWVFMTNLAQEVASIVDDMEAEKPQGLQERTEESYRNLVMDILEKCTWLPDKTLRDCKFWFFPLCTNQHFVVYCLDLKSRCFTFMNSVESVFHGSRYHKVGNMVLKHAIEFFGWNVHHPFKFKEFLWSESRDLGFRQTGNTACGVFALNFLEFWNGIMEPGWKERWDDPNYINERWSQCLKNLLLDEANLRRAYLEKKVVEDHAQLLQLSLSGEEGCGRPCPVASAEFSTLAMELPL